MAYVMKHISGLDVMVDETTGAILVDASGVTLTADVVQVDVDAIVDGIAGATPKTLADLYTPISGIVSGIAGATPKTLAEIHTALGTIDTSLGTIDASLGTLDTAVDRVYDALTGSGNPVPLAFSDPGDNGYAQASPASTGVITRDCYRLRAIVGESGCVISLDGGTTDHISLPPNFADEIGVRISSGADIRVKRYSAGVAMTDLVVEVR